MIKCINYLLRCTANESASVQDRVQLVMNGTEVFTALDSVN